MPNQILTIEVPEPLYQHLKGRAEKTRRSVEEESVQLLKATMPSSGLPNELAEEIATLQTLDEPALWSAARSRLSADDGAELEALNRRQGQDGLSVAEMERQAELVAQYERQMLIRAQAAVLLKRRGHDIASLLAL